jgi:nitroreductase
MDALKALLTRRSTRRFKADPVEQEKLDMILRAAAQAPSGGNNQTSHFLVIRNKDIQNELASMAEKAFSQMEATEDTYRSLRNAINASKKGGYVFHYNAPVLIAVANQKDYSNNIADCACALENMMIAANALDLGSCWVNQLKWLNDDDGINGYLMKLGMKESERVYGALVLGYPDTADGLPNREPTPRKGNEVTFAD